MGSATSGIRIGCSVFVVAAVVACGTSGGGGMPPAEVAAPTGGQGGAGGSGAGSSDVTGGSGGASGVGGNGAAAASGGSGGTGRVDAGAGEDAGVKGADAAVDAATAHAGVPSAGCAKATARPVGGTVTEPDAYYLTFPGSYDGTTPYPVLMAFHGCASVNRGTTIDNTEWIPVTNGTPFESEYVRAVPLSADSGGCWNYGNDIDRVKAMYDALVGDYCVDTSRVFATGHSSGAQFVVQVLLSSHVDDAAHFGFAGVTPFAASDYGPMTGPIPVMYVQGMMDAERGYGDGHETVDRFRAANGCADTSMPYAGVAGCQSGTTSVEPGCITYDGCNAPTVWCSHDDPAYGGTMHGIPCFGMAAMYDFFESLN